MSRRGQIAPEKQATKQRNQNTAQDLNSFELLLQLIWDH
jgi:hypothetical protein